MSGLFLSAIGQLLLPYATKLMGAEGELLEQGLIYGRISLIFLPALMLQYVNQYIFPTAEKSKIGMYFTVAAGIANIVFVLLFVVVFDMGVLGAGLANGIGQCIGGLLPLCYFFCKRNDSLLRPAKPVFKRSDFTKMCSNGASEFVTNLSLYIIGNLFNFQLLRMTGEKGVAAFGVIMYINMLFISVFTGYSIAVSPIIGFHNGAGNHQELKNVFQKSMKIIALLGVILTVLAMITAKPLSMLFVAYDVELLNLTVFAFRIYAISFLVMGINIFASAFFTALNNGVISAAISFLRTFAFQASSVLLLPIVFGVNGIWFSVTVAEGLALLVTIWCMIKNKPKYQY